MLYYFRKLCSYIYLFFFRGVLSDNDIKKLLGYHIFIYPFKKENLKPSSYNLTASKCAFIKDENGNQKLIVKDDKIIIPPNKTAIIETQESMYVSKWITGTYHSKVKLVNKGLGHIGTTLDPCFFGLSAIALHNQNNEEVTINVGDSIVTVMFYSLKSRSSGMHDNLTGRLDDGIKLDIEDFYDFNDKNKKDKLVFDYYMYIKSIFTCEIFIGVLDEKKKKSDIIKEIEEWKSQQWINNKESLIEKVKESVVKENNNKDTLIYSLLILVIGVISIIRLILLVNSGISKDMVEIVKVVIGVIIAIVPIIIGMIVNYKKIDSKN